MSLTDRSRCTLTFSGNTALSGKYLFLVAGAGAGRIIMLYGGHAKTPEDIRFLEDIGCNLAEVLLSNARIRQVWRDSGLKCPLSTGFIFLAHGPQEGPPNDADHLINRYYPEVRETITTAEALGVHLLTIHLWMDPRFVFPDIRKKKIEILQQLVPFSLDRGILLCLENLSESADVLTEILREVPHLALTLDIGHGQLLSETNTSFGIIERLTAAIQHVHIHDNRGGKGVKDDLHLPIGEGVIDFEQILGALLRKGYDRTVTLELHQDVLAASLKRVKDMIRRILNP